MYIIYLIESVNNDKSIYKIGYTKQNLNSRLQQLQTGTESTLKIIETYNTEYGSKLETTLHNWYNTKKIHGEWFELDLEDITNFKNICKKIEDNFNILKENNYHFKKYLKRK